MNHQGGRNAPLLVGMPLFGDNDLVGFYLISNYLSIIKHDR